MQEKIEVATVDLDMQEHINALAEAQIAGAEFQVKVKAVRYTGQKISEAMNEVRKTFNEIVKTMKVQKNTKVGVVKTRYNNDYEIYINAAGLRGKSSYYSQTSGLGIDEFQQSFCKDLILAINKNVKDFQKDRFDGMMGIVDEIGDVKKYSPQQVVIKIETPVKCNVYSRYDDFAWEECDNITLPDVNVSGKTMSLYHLVQFRSFLEPYIDEYLAAVQVQLDEIKELDNKLKAQYPLLFLFSGGKSE